MSGSGRTGLILSLAIILVCIVIFLNGSTSGYIPIVIVLTLIILVPVSIAMSIGEKIRKEVQSSFRKVIDPLHPQYMTFYGRLYASLDYKGYSVSITSSSVDMYRPAVSPYKRSSMFIARTKIPKTSGRKFHMAVVPYGNGPVRKMLGWTSPENGFFLAGREKPGEEEHLSTFMKLSAAAKEAMKKMAAEYGSCGISPDWESVMIGKENSLKLHGGDQSLTEQLDFQLLIPAALSETELVALMDEIVKVIKLISKDLAV